MTSKQNHNKSVTQRSGDPSMSLKIWGVRGTIPAPATPGAVEKHVRELFNRFFDHDAKHRSDLDSFFLSLPQHVLGGFGGNTSCLEVKTSDGQLIVDAGSGIRPLGYEMMKGPCGTGSGEVHILFTHFHWDHLIGLPFFTPIFIPGNRIHVYAVQPELPEIFRTLFRKPFFPVAFEQLGSIIEYHQLEPRKPFDLAGVRVTPYQLDHPDPCWGYRFERGGKAVAHCVDTECTRVTPEQLGKDLPLYQNLDLMLFDAQYTLMETIEKVDWGHAAASLGLDIAIREGIKRVIFMHHDPASTDDKIAVAQAQAMRYYQNQLTSARRSGTKIHEVDWSFAYEGMTIDL